MPTASAKKRPRVGPGRLSAEDAAELPDRLLDAALVLFSEHGFSGTSMDQIAKTAGASTKTLYSRFNNKIEILEAVITRNVQRTVADVLRGFALRPEETEPREYLTKFAMQLGLANLAAETAGIMRVSFAEGHRFPVLARLYRETTGRGVEAIANALRVWRETGQLEFEEDPRELAKLAFGISDVMRIRAVLGDPMPRSELHRHVDLAVDVFLRGIKPERRTKARK
jgi:TetR/AcrR family transcriptional regulator, mexJK operon transcriptional repressor